MGAGSVHFSNLESRGPVSMMREAVRGLLGAATGLALPSSLHRGLFGNLCTHDPECVSWRKRMWFLAFSSQLPEPGHGEGWQLSGRASRQKKVVHSVENANEFY